MMDPMGFALENFDATGTWRTLDGDAPVDASGVLVDGTKVNGVADLRNYVKRRSGQFVRVITDESEDPRDPLYVAFKDYALENVATGGVATTTAAEGRSPDLRHLMSMNFSAPRSAPKPASVTT